MTTTAPLLIVGRGASTYAFDDWDSYPNIMAVSSGVFALPEHIIPQHFVSMDGAQFFNAPLSGHQIAWQNDAQARQWPFWADATIVKHVSSVLARPGDYRPFPFQRALDAVALCRNPDKAREQFFENFEWINTHYGHQPGWGDYSNVHPWEIVVSMPPNFTDVSKPLGLDHMRNSVFMAVQIAALSGFRNIHFVGVFDGEGYEQHREVFQRWHDEARTHGMTWSNAGKQSLLGTILPNIQTMEMAA